MSKPTVEQLRDPDYTPPMHVAIPLGIQHVLAMFVSNFTPAIIIGLAAGYSFGSPDLVYMIQIAMLFSGIATLIQTVGFGPVGARLPIMQGTSFAFIPVMIPAVKTVGMAGLFGGILVGSVIHTFLGFFIGRMRGWLPPLVTGLIVLTIGLSLIAVGIQYAAGGVPMMGKPEFGSGHHWMLAGVVILVTILLKSFTKGLLSSASVLIGLLAGYGVAYLMGDVNLGKVAGAAWFQIPQPFKYGITFDPGVIIGITLMAFVSAIETVGDISGITKGGAQREATDKEISGGTFADGIGSFIAGIFGGLPNTSFSQNVGLIALTGVMSRTVVTIGALLLILCGLVPKVGAVISTMPISVLGGGVIIMFGMVASAGLNMLSDVKWNSRNMLIVAVALSVGLGLKAVPEALQHLNTLMMGDYPIGKTIKMLLSTGILPVALVSIVLNLVLPEED